MTALIQTIVRKWKALSPRDRVKHVVLYLLGVGVMPLGVVLTINAHLGAGGYDALNFALGEKLHIHTSVAIYGTALIALLLASLIRRKFPNLLTFVSSFFIGLFTDFWKWVLAPVEAHTLVYGIVLAIIGVIVIGFAAACYVISIFPTNPTDDLVVAMHEKGWDLGLAKIVFDAVTAGIAWLFGGEIGLGTLFVIFGLGPVIDVFHKLILRVTGLTEQA